MEKTSYIFSEHANQQIAARNLNMQLIVDAIAAPDFIQEEDGLTVYMKVVIEVQKSYLLRIFINKNKEPNVVVTVYKTSKIKKYYEGYL